MPVADQDPVEVSDDAFKEVRLLFLKMSILICNIRERAMVKVDFRKEQG